MTRARLPLALLAAGLISSAPGGAGAAAGLVDAKPGVHQLSFSASGHEPTTVLVRVVRDWTTRVRLTLIPAR